MLTFLLAVLAALCAAALVALSLTVRGRNKRLLLSGTYAMTADTPDGIGISVLCSGVRTPEQVENLLSTEYARYEVVVVLDSRRYPLEFRALAARYRIIRVEYVPSEELPVTGVRGLGRSRRRCFRRLVLVDRKQDTPEGDFDAAAGVAAYDYVLPLREGQCLLPGTVGRLMAELGASAPGACGLVRTPFGRVSLLAREEVVSTGGFSHAPGRRVRRGRRKTLWEPFVCDCVPRRRMPAAVRYAGALLLAAGIAATASKGWWHAAAVLLTVALVWSAAGCIFLALGDLADACTGEYALHRSRRGSPGAK